MSVSDRLREIVRSTGSSGASMVPAAGRPRAGFGAPAGLESVLGGRWAAGRSGGRTFVVEREYAPVERYGMVSLGDFASALDRGMGAAALLMGGRAVAPPFVFFDLETTGLNGGAGTLAFLVGCGSFADEGRFRIRQYLLTGPADERPMLESLLDDLTGAGALVSFNGKSFDAPLLEMRFAFHRMPEGFGVAPHLDVLHPSRRFWKGSEGGDPAFSLSVLEHRLLGARRTADIAGCEIPARYFEFVRTGDARLLAAVLEHNRRDLLALAGVTARLLALVDAGPAATADAREALALGRLYTAARRDANAAEAFEQALASSGPLSEVRIDALRALADLRRRNREHQGAADCWQQLLSSSDCPRHVAHEAAQALAVHHEHRVRDLGAAKAFALRSLEDAARPARSDALRYRLARIERKMAGVDARSLQPALQLQG